MPAILARHLLPRVVLGAAAALAATGAALVPASSARPRRATVQAAAIVPHGDRRLGPLDRAATLRGAVVLRPRNGAALTRFVAGVTDPGSADFHHYLRPGRFAGRFGPAPGAGAAVAAVLRAAGLRVERPSGDGLLVPFSGSAAVAEQAFATRIQAVRLPGGATGHATAAPVSLPAPVAGSVAAVVGLDDTTAPRRIGAPARRFPDRTSTLRTAATTPRSPAASPPPPAAGPTACPAAQAAALRNGGLTDDRIAAAYGAPGLYGAGDTGVGQHIALYELEPFLRSDIQTFDTCYFGAPGAARMLGRLHVVGVDGGQPHGPGSGEASLDVEDLSAIAPGASIDVFVGPSPNANPSTYDALDEYAAIVDADRDQVVSTSWGLCEQSVQHGQPGLQEAENLLFQQAAAQGQTVFSAAGDNGSDDCNTNQTATPAAGQNPVSVDDPASQPYVLGVGGTAIDDAQSQPPLEHAWNDGAAAGAGGGGISMSWEMPAWQVASRVPGIARPGGAAYRTADRVERAAGFPAGFCGAYVSGATRQTPCRLVPDVSAQADEFTGAITVYSRSAASKHDPDGWTVTGGTSSAAPIWAAALALINASPACAAQPTTRDGVGFAAPLLYDVASDPARDAVSFNDVRTGNNDVYGLANGGVFAAGRGFDPASGLGSPRLSGPGGTAGLAGALCGVATPSPRPAVTAVRPRTGAAAGGEPVTVTGSGFAARGASRVAGVQVGSWRVPASRVRVRGPHTLSLLLPPARRTVPPVATAAQDGAGSAAIVVTLRGGQSSTPGPQARFTYVDRRAGTAVPTVGAIVPTGGAAGGGRPVTVLGSGFDRATAVSFGGVRARRMRIDGPDRITATPPPRSGQTVCAPLPRRGVYRHETAANDVCQAEVRVSDRRGASAPVRIRTPLEGVQVQDAEADLIAPSGCRCEVAPAAAEYDYLPVPRITSVSTSRGPASLASERGTTTITVHGSGLNPLDLEWADFGDPRLYSSVAVGYSFVSGTEMQIRAPSHALTADRAAVAFSVRTLAGQSAPRAMRYAGRPAIARVVNDANPTNLDGVYGGPDTGRTPLTVTGRGMHDQVIGLQYVDVAATVHSIGTQYTFATHGDTRLTAETVAQNPALVAVEPCTVTGCTPAATTNRFLIYPPGAPTVDSLAPAEGPAAGGTATLVGGQNLGCPLSVQFGSVPATKVTPVQAALACGSTVALSAVAPPGMTGGAVPVTVTTAESFFTGDRPATTALFAYR